MKKSRYSILSAILLATVLFAGGCTRYHEIGLNYLLLKPDTGTLGDEFQGASVVIGDVFNYAENTSLWGYYSATDARIEKKKLFYATGNLTYYFWHSLQIVFNSAGITVYSNDNPHPGLPSLQFILKNVTDMEFVFEMQLKKIGGPDYFHEYAIKSSPFPSGELSDAELQQWSFETINKVALTILRDPEFKKSFLAMQK